MAIEMLVGLSVINDGLYQKYREGISPILHRYGGAFGYDFKISEVLKSETEAPINRVFTIFFKNTDAMHAFFIDEQYLAVRNRYFEPSVSATTIISTHQR